MFSLARGQAAEVLRIKHRGKKCNLLGMAQQSTKIRETREWLTHIIRTP